MVDASPHLRYSEFFPVSGSTFVIRKDVSDCWLGGINSLAS